MSESEKADTNAGMLSDNVIAKDEVITPIIEKPNKVVVKKNINFDKCFEQLLEHIQEEDITFSNVINIITKSVEITESFTSATGLEKKNLSLRMVKKAIIEFEQDMENRNALLDFVDTVAPSMIDTIIYVSKGKLAINVKKTLNILKKLTNKMKSCCS